MSNVLPALDAATQGKLSAALRTKLVDMFGEADDTLLDYILLIVSGRDKQSMCAELDAFFSEKTEDFVHWLWREVSSLTAVPESSPRASRDEPTRESRADPYDNRRDERRNDEKRDDRREDRRDDRREDRRDERREDRRDERRDERRSEPVRDSRTHSEFDRDEHRTDRHDDRRRDSIHESDRYERVERRQDELAAPQESRESRTERLTEKRSVVDERRASRMLKGAVSAASEQAEKALHSERTERQPAELSRAEHFDVDAASPNSRKRKAETERAPRIISSANLTSSQRRVDPNAPSVWGDIMSDQQEEVADVPSRTVRQSTGRLAAQALRAVAPATVTPLVAAVESSGPRRVISSINLRSSALPEYLTKLYSPPKGEAERSLRLPGAKLARIYIDDDDWTGELAPCLPTDQAADDALITAFVRPHLVRSNIEFEITFDNSKQNKRPRTEHLQQQAAFMTPFGMMPFMSSNAYSFFSKPFQPAPQKPAARSMVWTRPELAANSIATAAESHTQATSAPVPTTAPSVVGGSGSAIAKSAMQCAFFPNCQYGSRCAFTHPVIPCRFGAGCTNKLCCFVHPQGHVPGAPATAAVSSIAATTPCRFQSACTNPACPYLHHVAPATVAAVGDSNAVSAEATLPCRFGVKCSRADCKFEHKQGRAAFGDSTVKTACRFDEKCTNIACIFDHPQRDAKSAAFMQSATPITKA